MYASSAYHQRKRGALPPVAIAMCIQIQHNVMKFVSNLWLVDDFLIF